MEHTIKSAKSRRRHSGQNVRIVTTIAYLEKQISKACDRGCGHIVEQFTKWSDRLDPNQVRLIARAYEDEGYGVKLDFRSIPTMTISWNNLTED